MSNLEQLKKDMEDKRLSYYAAYAAADAAEDAAYAVYEAARKKYEEALEKA